MISKSKLRFFNTLSRKVEDFVPISEDEVGVYTCGPTVYSRAHIGNLKAYICADVLRRTLEYAGYNVKHVMNITDVGHLTSDADEGEDKLQKSARLERITAWDVAKKYTDMFLQDAKELNMLPVHVLCRATDHIPEQIRLVERLEENGFTYVISDGVYFDTSRFPDYPKFARLNVEGLEAGKRIDMGEKKNKTDFALWKFSRPEEKRDMEWDSPWGRGFPGWHIECSAMSMRYLGETFDIHTGGIDHISVHHTNEIAQSQCGTGKKFVNYWLHSEFLVLSDQEKMSKSLGNVIDLDTIRKKGFSPMAFRYTCLNAQYSKRLLFGEKILETAAITFSKLKEKVIELKEQLKGESAGQTQVSEMDLGSAGKKYLLEFKGSLFNDLNTPEALATMWTMLRDDSVPANEKYALLIDFDKVLGLGIKDMVREELVVPQEVAVLLEEREKARKLKDWEQADKIRDEILSRGYQVIDESDGPRLEKA